MSAKVYKTNLSIPDYLLEKVQKIKMHQTERTARELSEKIEEIFSLWLVKPRRPLFYGTNKYYLQFIGQEEITEIGLQKTGSRTAVSYSRVTIEDKEHLEPPIIIVSCQAYQIPSRREEIVLKKLSRKEEIPIGILIGEKEFHLQRDLNKTTRDFLETD